MEDLQRQINELKTRLDIKTKLFDIQGVIRTVNVIPTSSPVNVESQILIYIDDLTTPTDKRLYIYSTQAKIWSYVTLT